MLVLRYVVYIQKVVFPKVKQSLGFLSYSPMVTVYYK
jgi:hypothetical protein